MIEIIEAVQRRTHLMENMVCGVPTAHAMHTPAARKNELPGEANIRFPLLICRQVKAESDIKGSDKQLFGWIGLICLVLIIPVKAIRFADATTANTLLVGIAPSLLGPAGLFFLMLSASGRLSRLTLLQIAALAAVIALGLEFGQLLPRPGILAKVHYTFDWLDILASILSVCVGYIIALIMTRRKK